MFKRWLFYLTALVGCGIFVAAYQGWLAWLLLTAVGILPWLSLLLSLPFMILARPVVEIPEAVTAGCAERLSVNIHTPLIRLPWRCRFRVRHNLTGEDRISKPGDFLPTRHCGQITCTGRGFYVYDLLGLFRLPRKLKDRAILVYPQTVPMPRPEDLEQSMSRSWRPKYGGGFAENHERRLFRPGDSMNQVHWKLTAKTGKLTVREPMVPNIGRVLLSVTLFGDSVALDRKLGRLVWMGRYLLGLGLKYELHAMTGAGMLQLTIADEQDFNRAMHRILSSEAAREELIPAEAAFWHFHIGGDPDEA